MNPSRRSFVKNALALAAGSMAARALAQDQLPGRRRENDLRLIAENRPNPILILADDLGSADVSWRGSEARTPNLVRLVKQGGALEAHYTAPVCSPTRAGLLTGRYWSRYGIILPDSRQCLPD